MTWHHLSIEEIKSCSGKTVVIDIETTGLLWYRDSVIGVGIYCPEVDVCGYYPTPHENKLRLLKSLLNDWSPETKVIAHNLKFELHFLDLDPFTLGWTMYDTAILAHLIDSRYPKALDKVEKIFLGTESKKEWVSKAPHKSKKKIWEWDLDLVAPYCINDCVVEYRLFEVLVPQVVQLNLWQLFLKDMNYMKEIWYAERAGMYLDEEFFLQAEEAMEIHERELEQELWDSVGYEFNWRSPKQLSKALYDGMGFSKPKNPYADADGIDRSKFADKGLYHGPMTSTFILMEKAKHPLGGLVSALREAKLLKTTIRSYLDLRDFRGFIHPSFNITGTRTGRLSSRSPNVQNVASMVRTRATQSVYSGAMTREDEFNLRQGFVPDRKRNHIFVSVDYSQMEMRMFGFLSGDPNMLESLGEGRDIHGDIAEAVWGSRDKVHREWAKTVSFGLIYGATAGSLNHRLGISLVEARKLQADYFKAFPRIQGWMHEVIERCNTEGRLRYWSGRLWHEENPAFSYKGANALIQGGCADVLSIVAIRLGRYFRKHLPEARIVNFIHDELMVECEESLAPMVAAKMQEIMKAPDLFELPWAVSASIGDSYGTFKEITGAEY